MAGFTGFSFSSSSLPSSSSPFTSFPPFAASSSSSASATTSFNSGSTSNPSYSFGTSSSTPSFGSSAPTDEATIKKIAEAIELLEKLAKNGVFPQDKLEEIKKELRVKYPNLFNKKTQNNSQGHNPQNPESYDSPFSFTASFANSNMFQQQLQQQLQQQQKQRDEMIKQYELIHQQKLQQQLELIKQYEVIHQQQLNHQIQAAQQEYMKVYQTTAAGLLSPYNIYGNYPISYNNYNSTNNGNTTGDALNMVLEMMGQSNNNNNGGLMSNILGSTVLGSDGFSSLSFLGSLLGGFGL